MSVGAAFSFDGFLAAADFLPVMFAAVAGTLLLSLAGGWLIWRLTGLDRRTSLLGSTPGAASTMVILSGELGADARMVALLQFMRHVAMLAAAPVLISQAFSSVGGSMPAQMEPPPQEAALMGSDVGAAADVSWTAVPIWALCAWAGTAVGRRLRLPAYGFLGPMLAAMALANLFPGPKAPGSIFEAALGVVGLSVGLQFDTAALRRMGPVAVVNAIWIVVLTAGCAGLGWMYARISGSALATGLLATAPGGMEAMVAAAIEMGADVTTVVTLQTLRLLTILIAAPTLARRWRARRNA